MRSSNCGSGAGGGQQTGELCVLLRPGRLPQAPRPPHLKPCHRQTVPQERTSALFSLLRRRFGGRPALSAFSWAASDRASNRSPHGIVLCSQPMSLWPLIIIHDPPHTRGQRLRATRGPTAHPHLSAAAPSLKPPQPPAAIGSSASARLRNKRASRHGPSPPAASTPLCPNPPPSPLPRCLAPLPAPRPPHGWLAR
jgi:hypothetical protein